MLRVAIPYGLLSSTQLRALGSIARRYDRGYGHFTTRQNIQYNWPKLEQVPDILAELAEVEMHCDPDQRQLHPQHHLRSPRRRNAPMSWRIRGRGARSSANGPPSIPEFTYLPRKFKIAVTGAAAGSGRLAGA